MADNPIEPECPPAEGNPDRRLQRIAWRYWGVFRRNHAVEAGLTPRMIRRRRDNGHWIVVYPDVYRLSAVPPSRRTAAMAALLYAGPDAMFGCLTAARLHRLELPSLSSVPWVLVPHDRYLGRRPGLEIVRTRHMPEPVTLFGYPASPLPRTVLDLAQVLDKDSLSPVVHDALRKGLVSFDQLLGAAEGFGGKPGLALFRKVLDEYDPLFDSVLGEEAGQRFARGGLRLARQFPISDGPFLVAVADFADEQTRLAVFVDGWGPHSTRQAQDHDKRQDRTLRRLGWEPMRFTTNHVRRHPDEMVREVANYIICNTPAA